MPAKKQTKKQTKAKSTKKAKEIEKSTGINSAIVTILLFMSAVLLMFITVIKGENLWRMMHDFLFGIFGVCAFILPVLLGLIAVMMAFDRLKGKIKSKVILSTVLCVLIIAAVDIFTNSAAEDSFFKYISTAYSDGVALHGGGVIGGLIGYPLTLAFAGGAKIIVIIAIITLALITAGVTLRDLLSTASRPLKKAKEIAEEKRRQRELDKENEVAPEDLPAHPVQSDTPFFEDDKGAGIAKKRKRLISAYNDSSDEAFGKRIDKNPFADGETADISVEDNTEEEDTVTEIPPTPKKRIVKPTPTPVEDKPKYRPTRDIDNEGEKPIIPADMPKNGVVIESVTSSYRYPPTSLLRATSINNAKSIEEELRANCDRLVNILGSFGVEARVIGYSRGPSVTRYEVQPSVGVKISKITNLSDDIALQLKADKVRISAIPSKSAVGIEVPNTNKTMVGMRDIIESPEFTSSKSKLTVALGRDIQGSIQLCNLAKMPHLLVAGTTGSGKSVCLNTMLMSILYNATPDEVKFVMIDPKEVEFNTYNGIPHLLVPVVSDPRKAAGALGWAVVEMDKRYKLLSQNGVRNLQSYNELCKTRDDLNPMPQIVIVIDEFADLMMVAGNEVEDSVCRIAQKARAAGMHLVIATQRPSADIFTGIIKSNIPSRIALMVSSQTNSQIILDQGGAEKLLGNGDMLYAPVGLPKPVRIQGAYVSDEEIRDVVEFIKNQNGEPTEYDEEVMSEIERQATETKKGKGAAAPVAAEGETDGDERLNEAIEVVVEAGLASTSLLQRKLKLGYARAARIIDEMHDRGIIGPFEGAKPRKVLITKQQWMEMQLGAPDAAEVSAGELIEDDGADEAPFDEE